MKSNFFKNVQDAIIISGISKFELIKYAALFFLLSCLDIVGLGLLKPLMASDSAGFLEIHSKSILAMLFVTIVILKSVMALVIFDNIIKFSLNLREKLILNSTRIISPGINFDLNEAHTSTSLLIDKFSGLLIREGMKAVSDAFTILVISVYILYTEPVISLITLIIFGSTLIVYNARVKKRVVSYGEKLNNASETQFRIIGWMLNGKETLKIYGFFDFTLNRLRRIVGIYNKIQGHFLLLNAAPKYLFEISAALSLVSIFIYFEINYVKLEEQLGILSVFGFAIIRLIPSVKQVSSTIIQFAFHENTIKRLKKFGLIGRDLITTSSIIQKKIGPVKGLKFEVVTISRNNTTLVDRFSYVFEPGRVYRILGMSGTGKSSILKSIAGFLKLDSGSITDLDGQNLDPKSVSLIAQKPFIMKGTVRYNICFKNFLSDNDEKKLNILLNKFGLVEQGLDPSFALEDGGDNISGGQSQRVELCRAFFADKNIILLDEPTSALDRENSSNLMRILDEICEKCIIIIVTHDEGFAPKNDVKIRMENIGPRESEL